MTDPIEIRAEDIIKRPADLALKAGSNAASAKEPGILEQVKGYMNQYKEWKKMADELGLGDQLNGILGNLGLNLPGGQRKKEATSGGGERSANTARQVQSFIKLLKLHYGDITVNQALEKLRADFGNVPLSEFIKDGLE